MIQLSVIIVNWNTADLLRQCLKSLFKHIRKTSMEIIVVDNGSTDASVSMIRTDFQNVRLIENESNYGFAKANNQGMKVANGRFFLLLNTDTLIIDEAIEQLVAYMAKNPKIGMAGLQLLNHDGSLQNSVANIPTLLTELTNKSALRRLWPEKYPGKEFRPEEPMEVESLVGACLLVRASMIKEIGFLDEDYFFFLEETDWCLRAKKADWKIIFHPRLSIYHLQGKSAAKAIVDSRIEYWRSRYLFFRKHYGKFKYFCLYTGLLMKLLVNINFVFLFSLFSQTSRERLTIYAKLLLWHIKGRPKDLGLCRKPKRKPLMNHEDSPDQ